MSLFDKDLVETPIEEIINIKEFIDYLIENELEEYIDHLKELEEYSLNNIQKTNYNYESIR